MYGNKVIVALVLTLLLLSEFPGGIFEGAAFQPVLQAGEYSEIRPGSGITGTAHDLRRGRLAGNYNPATVGTLQGRVVRVERSVPWWDEFIGVHMRLRTDGQDMVVLLGPAWYVDNREPQIRENETVTVTGSRVIYGGDVALLAASVKRGDRTLELRDVRTGVPFWRGRRIR